MGLLVRLLPNGSRLSCGASASRRKRSTMRDLLAGAQTPASPEAGPASFKRMLGSQRSKRWSSGRPQPLGVALFGQQALGKINTLFQLTEALLHFIEFRESALHVDRCLQWLALQAAPPILWGHEPDVNDLQDRDKNQDGAHTDCPLRKSEHYPPTSKRTCVAGQHHCENAHESQIPQRRPSLGRSTYKWGRPRFEL